MTIASIGSLPDGIEAFCNDAEGYWQKTGKNTYVCLDYRAVLIVKRPGNEVRALTTNDVSRWDLWGWFGPEDFDDDGELITEWGNA